MPPKAASKRAAPANSESAAAKKTKTAAAVPAVPKSKRWAALSASRNADADFKLAVQDVERANSYICICKPYFLRGDDEDDEDDSEDDGEDEDAEPKPANGGEQVKCDGGDKCPCQKPPSEHPEHDCIVTYAGFRKWIAQRSMAAVRNPDVFGMYTYNDHEAYGMLEVCQNLMLDWVEAKTWQEQWAVCEAFVFFLLGDGSMFQMIDDGEQAMQFATLIGRLFLTMLARLEAQNLLKENSEVKNLGMIMALYIKIASVMRSGDLLEVDEEDTHGRFTWDPSSFDDYVNAYGTKYGITLYGPPKLDDLTANLDTDVTLPTAEASWGWTKAFKAYQRSYASGAPQVGRGKSTIGGDALDITTWSSADRKGYSFDEKDPLTAAEIKSLKAGAVLSC